jgi:ABC-2 type transport system ATP-binding protein
VTVARLVWWTATVALAIAIAPPIDPWFDLGVVAMPLGIAAGAALFVALARKRVSPAALTAVPRERLLARTVVLTVKAAHEEAVWRAVVLGFLVGPAGRAGAVAVSSFLFAAAHVNRLGARATQHVATGAVFGLAYLATGWLAAAIGAHAAYNVLIGIGRLSLPDVSLPATGEQAQTIVRSPGQSRPVPPRDASHLAVSSPSVASLVAVSKTFGAVRALDRLDLELRQGEVVGLLGPNGAGKSTAISILLGLRRPDEGRAALFGRNPRETRARQRIGVVLQEVSLPPVLRVGELVELVRAHYEDPAPQAELLERLDLGELAGTQIGGLSGGQRRRLAMALALVGRPHALFLHEPTAAIDAGGRRVLWRELSAFAAAGGAILVTTQQLEEAERYATRLVVISHGRIVGEGTVGEIRARVGKATVRLRAEQLPQLPGAIVVESTLDRHVVHVDDPERYVAELVRSGIRYHDLEVARPSLEDAFVTLTGEET